MNLFKNILFRIKAELATRRLNGLEKRIAAASEKVKSFRKMEAEINELLATDDSRRDTSSNPA